MENYLLLVKQAKSGDTKAFAELYKMVYEDMYRFALYTLRDREDAKDVVSDTVLDAFSTIGRLKNEESFRCWIFKILSNKCKRILGSYRQKTEELTEIESAGMEEAEGAVIRSLFFSLSEEERLILALHMFGGYTSKEASACLGMNENTLRSKESRALKKLASQLNEVGGA